MKNFFRILILSMFVPFAYALNLETGDLGDDLGGGIEQIVKDEGQQDGESNRPVVRPVEPDQSENGKPQESDASKPKEPVTTKPIKPVEPEEPVGKKPSQTVSVTPEKPSGQPGGTVSHPGGGQQTGIGHDQQIENVIGQIDALVNLWDHTRSNLNAENRDCKKDQVDELVDTLKSISSNIDTLNKKLPIVNNNKDSIGDCLDKPKKDYAACFQELPRSVVPALAAVSNSEQGIMKDVVSFSTQLDIATTIPAPEVEQVTDEVSIVTNFDATAIIDQLKEISKKLYSSAVDCRTSQSIGIILGSVFGSVGGILLIVAAVMLFLREKANKKDKPAGKQPEEKDEPANDDGDDKKPEEKAPEQDPKDQPAEKQPEDKKPVTKEEGTQSESGKKEAGTQTEDMTEERFNEFTSDLVSVGGEDEENYDIEGSFESATEYDDLFNSAIKVLRKEAGEALLNALSVVKKDPAKSAALKQENKDILAKVKELQQDYEKFKAMDQGDKEEYMEEWSKNFSDYPDFEKVINDVAAKIEGGNVPSEMKDVITGLTKDGNTVFIKLKADIFTRVIEVYNEEGKIVVDTTPVVTLAEREDIGTAVDVTKQFEAVQAAAQEPTDKKPVIQPEKTPKETAAQKEADRKAALEAKLDFKRAYENIEKAINLNKLDNLAPDVMEAIESKIKDLTEGGSVEIQFSDGTNYHSIEITKEGEGFRASSDFGRPPNIFNNQNKINITSEVADIKAEEATTPVAKGLGSYADLTTLSLSGLEQASVNGKSTVISKLENIAEQLAEKAKAGEVTFADFKSVVSSQFEGIDLGEKFATEWNNLRNETNVEAYDGVGERLPTVETGDTGYVVSMPDILGHGL